jgi:hypothetical protein
MAGAPEQVHPLIVELVKRSITDASVQFAPDAFDGLSRIVQDEPLERSLEVVEQAADVARTVNEQGDPEAARALWAWVWDQTKVLQHRLTPEAPHAQERLEAVARQFATFTPSSGAAPDPDKPSLPYSDVVRGRNVKG